MALSWPAAATAAICGSCSPPPLPRRRFSRAAAYFVPVCPTGHPGPLFCAASAYPAHPFSPEVAEAVESLYSEFREVDNLVAHNTTRVLKAFQNARVGSHHFGGCTGYGHDDGGGRGALDNVFAEIVGAESAMVRSQFFSGTHAITCALFALLRPGDEVQNPDCMVMVDNCYGEFVETCEPPMVGADLIAGSLIKNPGGTIAPCGGYVAGKKIWVEAAAARLSAPGLGVDCGSTPGDVMRAFFQGLFLSPQMVGEAIKGGLLIAEVMASKGYKVQPLPRDPHHDTVQAVQLGSQERLISFCEAVQKNCPIGSFVKPVAGLTAGYASEVIFADGTFIDGSTSELSCDGPLREPFTVFCQQYPHNGFTSIAEQDLCLAGRAPMKPRSSIHPAS
ncbi:uncharacterized protein YnbB-like isoform X3 [Phoenix dactylifera]|uniref:Uncharacterized protein YnbB-like isoform X3 n=1 Tax=Phoenix dactylifera TaxID=42345 RepID=A0A8B7D527_PHODC|nr:uncharacterized protein YnbB-like isoform X3 [Phoenix dactylifera]